MASRPTTIPQLDINKTNRVAPVSSKINNGYVLNDLFPSSNANYLHGWAGDWHEWLQERSEDGTTPGTDLTLRGLDALTATGAGGVLTLKGGDGGSTSGDGGDIVLLPGDITSGEYGQILCGADSALTTFAVLEINGTALSTTSATDVMLIASGDTNSYAEIGFASFDPTEYASWYLGTWGYQRSTNPGKFYLLHYRNIAGSIVNTLPFVVTDDDKIGLGNDVTSPLGTTHIRTASAGSITPDSGADDLVIEGSSYTGITIMGPATTAGGTIAFAYPGSPLAGQIYFDNDNDKLYMQVGASPNYLALDSLGNVGVGEDTPLGKVHIRTSDVGSISPSANADELVLENNGACGMTIYSNSSNSGFVYFADVDSDTAGSIDYAHGSDKMFLRTSSTIAIAIDSSQNVGIGENDPLGKLHVKSADIGVITPGASANELVLENSGDCGMTIYSGNTSAGYIAWGDVDDDTVTYLRYNHNNNAFTIYSNNSERLTIDSSGNFGFGTATIDTLLHLYGTAPDITFEDTTGDKFLAGNNGGVFRIRNVTDARDDFGIDGLGRVSIPATATGGQLSVITAGTAAIYAETNISSVPCLYVFNNGNNANRYGINIQCGLDTPASNNDIEWVRLFDGNGTYLSSIAYTTASPFAAFVVVSDERLKTNIVDTSVKGLDILKRLPLRSFDWKDGKRQSQDIAFVAQEVKNVYPPMASYDRENDRHCVASGILEPVIVKAIQELLAEVEALKQKLN